MKSKYTVHNHFENCVHANIKKWLGLMNIRSIESIHKKSFQEKIKNHWHKKNMSKLPIKDWFVDLPGDKNQSLWDLWSPSLDEFEVWKAQYPQFMKSSVAVHGLFPWCSKMLMDFRNRFNPISMENEGFNLKALFIQLAKSVLQEHSQKSWLFYVNQADVNLKFMILDELGYYLEEFINKKQLPLSIFSKKLRSQALLDDPDFLELEKYAPIEFNELAQRGSWKSFEIRWSSLENQLSHENIADVAVLCWSFHEKSPCPKGSDFSKSVLSRLEWAISEGFNWWKHPGLIDCLYRQQNDFLRDQLKKMRVQDFKEWNADELKRIIDHQGLDLSIDHWNETFKDVWPHLDWTSNDLSLNHPETWDLYIQTQKFHYIFSSLHHGASKKSSSYEDKNLKMIFNMELQWMDFKNLSFFQNYPLTSLKEKLISEKEKMILNQTLTHQNISPTATKKVHKL